ncbi:hypothetical protein [Fusobacterium sp. THCT1E2]
MQKQNVTIDYSNFISNILIPFLKEVNFKKTSNLKNDKEKLKKHIKKLAIIEDEENDFLIEIIMKNSLFF